MALPVNVSLPEVLAAASARLVHLSGETAGYLVLALADELGARPIRLTAAAVALGEGGELAVAGHEAASPDAVAAELRTLLASLLAHARPVPPSLRRIAEAPRLPGLAGLVRELEAALVPVNRAAAKRALSRLSRETARARSQVSTSAPEPLPLPPPTLSVEAIPSPAPPRDNPRPSASVVARRPPPLPAVAREPSTPGSSAQAPTPTPTPALVVATAPKPATAVSLELQRSPTLPADVAPPPAAVAPSTPAAVVAPAPPTHATLVPRTPTPTAVVAPAPPTPALIVATASALAEVAAPAPAPPERVAMANVSTEKLSRAASGEGTAGLVEAAAPSMPALGIAPVDVDALRRELRRLAGLDPA